MPLRSISCCMTVGREAPQVRAILEVVRPFVDEIVLAADARCGREVLEACSDLVDRPLQFAFEPPPARYIGWIHHQCTADWILRLDDDEVPGAELLEALHELVADRRPTHIALPRRHLLGTADRYISTHPWHPEYQVRLLQNLPGVWSFAGRVHHAAEVLGEQRRVAAPIYHLNYVLTALDDRRRKAELFESLNPGAMAEAYPVNALYLPEAWDGVFTAPVPPVDRPLIAAVHRPPPVDRTPAADFAPPPVTPLVEVDRFNRHRKASADAYRAELRIVEARRRLPEHGIAQVEVSARNLGDERWPPAHQTDPPIRLAYRWLHPDGAVAVAEGLRTPFEETVEPGQETRVMMAIVPPAAPGTYVLEVDVVHELVRWFDCAARATMAIEAVDAPPADAAPVGPPLARPDLSVIFHSSGLDGLDLRLLDYLPEAPGTFVEAGAHDGITQSNTLLLERTRGWRGLLVEPIPEQAARCRANRPLAIVEECALVAEAAPDATVRMHFSGLMSLVEGAMGSPEADLAHVVDGLSRQGITHSHEVTVPAATLSDVLDRHGLEDVDLLVLDVEGLEAEVLNGLDFARHRPAHLLVEARFRDRVEDVLGDRYETVAQLSQHDVLYRRRHVYLARCAAHAVAVPARPQARRARARAARAAAPAGHRGAARG